MGLNLGCIISCVSVDEILNLDKLVFFSCVKLGNNN